MKWVSLQVAAILVVAPRPSELESCRPLCAISVVVFQPEW